MTHPDHETRPKTPEVENENLRPSRQARPPRPATEPSGSAKSQRSDKTLTDPGSGEPLSKPWAAPAPAQTPP